MGPISFIIVACSLQNTFLPCSASSFCVSFIARSGRPSGIWSTSICIPLRMFMERGPLQTLKYKLRWAAARAQAGPLVGFLPATDPRIQGTLRAIEERLLIDGEFVLRYETENPGDGLPAGEGAFLASGFWLVGNYILQGRYAEARKLFDRLLSRCNDVGLLAEEFDPLTGRMLGNFPQAYSHVGLINCALNLSRQTGPAEERAELQGLPITASA